nr:hypothetical protein [Tanacetum cinerariifolium]
FLREPGQLERLLTDPSAAKTLLLNAQKNADDTQQVLALEPAGSAVPQRQFYLLPIFDAKETFDQNGQPVQLLNVASIDPGTRFLELARQVKATNVSSHSFNEDAFAGVMQAVNGMDWSGYGGRLILLVSDAGSLRKNDPYSSTQMNEAEVRQAALGKQIKIYALHLKTDAGKKNHAFAEQQYRTLTADANPQIGDLYVPVPGGDVQKFGERVSEIGSVFADLVHQPARSAQNARRRQPALQPGDSAPGAGCWSATGVGGPKRLRQKYVTGFVGA